jgi:hypothetical protein
MKKTFEVISFLEEVELSDLPDILQARFSGCEKIYKVSDFQLANHRISKGELLDWIGRIHSDCSIINAILDYSIQSKRPTKTLPSYGRSSDIAFQFDGDGQMSHVNIIAEDHSKVKLNQEYKHFIAGRGMEIGSLFLRLFSFLRQD